jgi:hypothetical protein
MCIFAAFLKKMHMVSGNCHTVHFRFFIFLIWLQLGHTHVVGIIHAADDAEAAPKHYLE